MKISQSWLEFERCIGRRPVLKGTSQEIRDKFALLGQDLIPLYSAPADTVVVKEGNFQGIPYRIYTPQSQKDTSLSKIPIGVYFHPGGFVVGNLDSDDFLCRTIAENTEVVIVSVDYRLAPEHKAPAQLEDAVGIVEWVYHEASLERGDLSRLFTIGTSAGAALALEVVRKTGLGQTGIPIGAVKGTVALSPVILHPAKTPEQVGLADTPIVDREALVQYFELCGAQPENADYFLGQDPESHRLFPPTYIVTCGFDPLRDDGRILEESLESCGVAVKRDHYELLPHAFWMVPTLPESKTFRENAFKGIKWVLSKMK